jgi:hypothetical protein
MRRASLASLLAGAVFAGLAPAARALPNGFGKGPGYCSEYGNRASRYRFEDVYACAATESAGVTPFDADGDESFQCVELAARFLWAVYGIWAGPGTGVKDGAGLVAVMHRRYPRIRVGFPAPGSVPVAGDVISLGPGGAVDGRFGHTAIVVSDDQRHGRFRVIGQNFPPGRAGEQVLRVDFRGRHNGRALVNGLWTAASWLELRHRPKPRGRKRRI